MNTEETTTCTTKCICGCPLYIGHTFCSKLCEKAAEQE